MTNFAALAASIRGKILQNPHNEATILYLATDSRKLVLPAYAVFFAIKGLRHDGHLFIAELYATGLRSFVVENVPENIEILYPEANFLLVENAITALQKTAQIHREQFKIPVLGITGSNGKTIVKEWAAQLLSRDHQVVRSPRSYNSQIGVPLSVWNIAAQHTFGVLEAGISLPNEMTHLQQVIQPTIGIFTNIGTAHDEGFTSLTQKIAEKWQLFRQCPVVIYNKIHTVLDHFIQTQRTENQRIIAWESEKIANNRYALKGLFPNNPSAEITLPFSDAASVENVLHCVALLYYLGLKMSEIQERVMALKPVSMRLELKEGINRCYLIDDSYNNDLAGLTLALDFLNQQNQAVKTRKTIILSDVPEAGANPKTLYKHIAQLLSQKNVSRVIGIGHEIQELKAHFVGEMAFFESTDAFLQAVNPQNYFANELILLKGARAFQFERIGRLLQEKVHGTRLEINLDALVHNLNFYRSKLKPQTKMMLMVKAFAYGSGSYEVANLLQFHRVDYLAVAYTDEGVALRQNGITLPIMVMNPSPETFDKLLTFKLEPEIYSFRLLNSFVQHIGENQAATIHLKIDTGMRRLGFEEAEIPQLTALLQTLPHLKVAAVFSHLAGSDEAKHNDFSHRQIATLERCAAAIEQSLGYSVIKHILNSPGIIRFPEAHFDMVRLGIGLYGLEVNNIEQNQLQTVGTLKTTISQIKKIPQDETIGYGRHGVATAHDTTIATIAIGYADGFSRAFSRGVGKVKIKGQLAPIVGNVCMDMCMVDITGIDAQEGDEVIIFDDTHTISELAQYINTIPYEILTNVSERVKRVFFTE